MTPEHAMSPPAATRHRLDRTHCLRLRGPLTLTAESGTLWITEDRDLHDHVIGPGAAHPVARGAWALVGSLGGDAVVRVQRRSADRTGWWAGAVHRAPSRAEVAS